MNLGHCYHRGLEGVLRVLHEAARTPNVESTDFSETFGKEKWRANETFKLLSSKAPIVEPATISQIMASSFEIDTIISILTPLLNVALEFQKGYSKFVTSMVSKLSKGINSLPEELLPVIFDYAVQLEGRAGWKQAVTLSQVSRRFRNIALAERNLWTTLSLGWNVPTERLETLVNRSGTDSLFRVFVDIHPDRDYFGRYRKDAIVDTLKPTIPRWKFLEVTECNREFYDPDLEGVRSVDIHYFFSSFFGDENGRFQDATNLREVAINGEGLMMPRDAYTLSLMSPLLRSLRCSAYLPTTSATFSSVTKFSFYGLLTPFSYQIMFTTFPAFLSSMPNMVELELEICGVGAHYLKAFADVSAVCPLVSSFRLRHFDLRMWSGSHDFIARFLHLLRLPRLEVFAVNLEIEEFSNNENECTQCLSDMSCALLLPASLNPQPNLRSLEYEITYKPTQFPSRPPLLPFDAFPKIFSIPLDKIPSVSTLAISTCTGVCFTHEGLGTAASSSLQEVTFVGCKNMKVGELRSAIRSLEDAGAWEGIKRVVVDDCPSLGAHDALEVVGEERLYMESSGESSKQMIPWSPPQESSDLDVTLPRTTSSNTNGNKPTVNDEQTFRVQEKKARKSKPKARAPAPVASTNRFKMLEEEDS